MITIWYIFSAFMLLAFLVLEGFDIGAGMLQYIVGKTEEERRLVITAIGPLWSWHEVWLVGFGGTLLLAFPSALALSFAGFYLAMILLIWALILRGVSIEVSGGEADPMWRTAWHVCFVISNVVLAILIGAALGNVARGVPIGKDGKFALALFTHFSPHGNVGILDWYTVSIALLILVIFAGHGANGLAHRTEGSVHDRSRRLAGRLWIIGSAFLAITTAETWYVRRDFLSTIAQRPIGWLGILTVTTGVIGIVIGLCQKRTDQAFVGSTLLLAGIVISGATGIFPHILRSTLAPEYSLSAYNLAAASNGLAIALVWWPVAFVFAIGYFWFIYRHYSGKVKPTEDSPY
jgi:cytochrome bd ubiquinol oxidase subunit II